MLELLVSLDFHCSICCHSMGVTLKCAGKGLKLGMHAKTSVKVPCPTCGSLNKIVFTPSGELHEVAPGERAFALPEPSFN